MTIRFPNLECVSLAMTSGAAPAALVAAPVRARFAADGGVELTPTGKINRATWRALRELGAADARETEESAQEGSAAGESFENWFQLFPLAREAGAAEIGDKTPVLFELSRPEQLTALSTEMLRLGNDRQSFRHFATETGETTLLRVLGPPYYTLLRALDRHEPDAPKAYVERSPRVWTELGWTHPFASQLRPPPGRWLLLQTPRSWTWIDEAPFREVYEIAEFTLSAPGVTWQAASLERRLSVPLRLAASSTNDPAELWVLPPDDDVQVEQLVRAADDELLGRLSFAVGELDGRRRVVLRTRMSKQSPPILVLSAAAYRSYLKLPTLFVPVGRRIHPPLRRDVVAKLLADDRTRITWLEPTDDGSFVPQSLPDSAFRPLSDWVDYVLDRERRTLEAWVSSNQFDFESFVCGERAVTTSGRDRPAANSNKIGKSTSSGVPPTEENSAATPATAESDEIVLAELVPEPDAVDMSEPAVRLRRLEAAFLSLDTPLDDPRRLGRWAPLARANAALEHRHDTTLCCVNSLWEQATLPPESVRDWLQLERQAARRASLGAADLDPLLRSSDLSREDVQFVVAHAAQAAFDPFVEESSPWPSRLAALSAFLERYESRLPMRVAWLGWSAVAKLSHGDVLALARARDRLLARLFQDGLSPEADLPSFVRAAGAGDAQRIRVLRERLLELRRLVASWIVEPPAAGPLARTGAYADLLLAYALARIGETGESRRIVESSLAALNVDPVHRWLGQAFEQRIDEASRPASARRPFDDALVGRLDGLDRLLRYKIDRLRQHSRILEPFERIDPYRRWHRRYGDDLSRDLARLYDLHDRDELSEAATRVLATTIGNLPARRRALTTILQLAPRLGDTVARRLLDQASPLLERKDDPVSQALLLEKSLVVAGHFGHTELVGSLVARFEAALPDIVQAYLSLQVEHDPENAEKLAVVEALFNESLRGLRKLGMRGEIDRLFQRLVALSERSDAATVRTNSGVRIQEDRTVKLRLSVAGSWYYFGQFAQAEAIADDARRRLFTAALPPHEQRNLACAYVAAVGHAPIATAVARVNELFESDPRTGQRRMAGISDKMTTLSHFSLSQLDVIEAAVLTLANEELMVNDSLRRWLDEEEYLIRRRMHRDVRRESAT